ncbi:MAG: DUF2784 domain-containing protein [Acidobacteriota bacterium]|nr:DUF2784 domain-containing protein [Acidobacteriota bacterium]
MIYRLLADLVVLVHLGFVALVLLGGILVLRRPRFALIHLPAAVWGAFIELAGWVCPLTPLEVRLRRLGGAAGYETSFVEQYLLPILYPAQLTRGMQIWLGSLVILVNVVIYGFVVWRYRANATTRS